MVGGDENCVWMMDLDGSRVKKQGDSEGPIIVMKLWIK